MRNLSYPVAAVLVVIVIAKNLPRAFRLRARKLLAAGLALTLWSTALSPFCVIALPVVNVPLPPALAPAVMAESKNPSTPQHPGTAQALSGAYQGEAQLTAALSQATASPRAIASTDFNEDGVADVVSGYAQTDGAGLLTLHQGQPADAGRPSIGARRPG